MEEKCEYSRVVEETMHELLKKDSLNGPSRKEEWVKIYQNRANGIIKNLENIKKNRQRLYMPAPFTFAISTTKAHGSNTKLDVKYLGQNVAMLTVTKDSIKITTKSEKKSKPDEENKRTLEENNKRDFGCEIILDDEPWRGKNARAFRKHFEERVHVKETNQEKRIETLLLNEFDKGTQKKLYNITPVKLAGIYYPMVTPLAASDEDIVKYNSRCIGGAIDILARTGTGGRGTYLCVIEVKDEAKRAESPDIVIKQAIKYAVFVRELLRSPAGESWWKIFGFRGNIKDKLLIHAVCAMPDNDLDKDFIGMKLPIEQDIIQLDCIYFKESVEEENIIESITSSLSYGKQIGEIGKM